MNIETFIHTGDYQTLPKFNTQEEFLITCCNLLAYKAKHLGKITAFCSDKNKQEISVYISFVPKGRTFIGAKSKQPQSMPSPEQITKRLHRIAFNLQALLLYEPQIFNLVESCELVYWLMTGSDIYNTLFFDKIEKYNNKNLSTFILGELKNYLKATKNNNIIFLTDNVAFIIPHILYPPINVKAHYYLDKHQKPHIAFEDIFDRKNLSTKSPIADVVHLMYGIPYLQKDKLINYYTLTDPLLFYLFSMKTIYAPSKLSVTPNTTCGLAFISLEAINDLLNNNLNLESISEAILQNNTEVLEACTKEIIENCYEHSLVLLKPILDDPQLQNLVNIND